MKKLLRSSIIIFWFPTILLLVWEILQVKSKNPFFPTPSKIMSTVASTLGINWMQIYLLPTLRVLVIGFTVGSLVGIFLGIFLGSNVKANSIFSPIVNFLRSIPSVAKVPVLITIFGIGYSTREISVAIAVIFPTILIVNRAVKEINPELIELSAVLNLGKLKNLVVVTLPAISGSIFTALQSGLQVGILVTIVSEMLGSARGIGAFISHSQSTYRITNNWVACILLGLIGILLNEALIYFGGKSSPWNLTRGVAK
jgi:ABC-type nitrate/sulfonate/bicarbonate transport system permease component